jgi:hypothetical protein
MIVSQGSDFWFVEVFSALAQFLPAFATASDLPKNWK